MGEKTGNLPAVDCFAWVRWKSLQEGAERLPGKEQTYPGGRAPGAGLGERTSSRHPALPAQVADSSEEWEPT